MPSGNDAADPHAGRLHGVGVRRLVSLRREVPHAARGC